MKKKYWIAVCMKQAGKQWAFVLEWHGNWNLSRLIATARLPLAGGRYIRSPYHAARRYHERGGDTVQDFRRYDYTIREADLLCVLRDAAAHGYEPTVVINGEFYDVELNAESTRSASSADLPF